MASTLDGQGVWESAEYRVLYDEMLGAACDKPDYDVGFTARYFLMDLELCQDRRAHDWVPSAMLFPVDVARMHAERDGSKPNDADAHTDTALSQDRFSTYREKLLRRHEIETFMADPSSVDEPPDSGQYECRLNDMSDAKGHLCFKPFTFGVRCFALPAGSRHEKRFDRAIALVLGHSMLTALMRRIKDADIQDSIISYLSNHIADRQLSDEAADGYLRGVLSGPFDVHQKVLILSALLGQPRSFKSELCAADYDAEFDPVSAYSVAFFEELSKAITLTGESLTKETTFGKLVIFDLMNKLPKETIPDILLGLHSPLYMVEDGLVVSCIIPCLSELDQLDLKNTTVGLQLCVKYHTVCNSGPSLWGLMMGRCIKHGAFAMALALQLVKSSDAGEIPQQTARKWFLNLDKFMWVGVERDIVSLAVDEEWDEGIIPQSGQDCLSPIDPRAIGQMVCIMVKMGWKPEVKRFLALGPFSGLPITKKPKWCSLVLSTMIHDQASNPSEWRDVRDVLRDFLLISACEYMLYHVQHEPRKYDPVLRRMTCRCSSCSIIERFLADDKVTRQVYPIFKSSYSPDESGCSCFTRMTEVAGPVLVVRKVRSMQKWQKWKKRKGDAVPRLSEILHFCLADTVNSDELRKWLSLDFLNRQELEWTIPIWNEDPGLYARVGLYESMFDRFTARLEHWPIIKNDKTCLISRLDRGIKLTWKPS